MFGFEQSEKIFEIGGSKAIYTVTDRWGNLEFMYVL